MGGTFGRPLKGDKGYQSKKNAELLKKRKLKNHLLKKATKNKILTLFTILKPCLSVNFYYF